MGFFVGFPHAATVAPSSLVTRVGYAPGVPPFWTAWTFQLWRVDYFVCSVVGMAGSCSVWLPGPALHRSCLSLIGGVTSFRSLGSPRACAVSLMGGIGAQEISGLVSAQEWVKTGPRLMAGPLVGRAVCWTSSVQRLCWPTDGLGPCQFQSWFWPSGQWAGSCHNRLWVYSCPGAGARPLVGRPGSLSLWLQASRLPRSSSHILACDVALSLWVGKAMSRGNCGLSGFNAACLLVRKAMCPCNYFPWPEVSKQWCLQAGGWGAGLVPRLIS